MVVSVTAQSQPPEVSQKEVYRLIVLDPAGTAVLLEPKGSEYQLPKVEIQQFTRPAKEVTEILRESWNMSSIFLFSGVLDESLNGSYFAVLESQDGLQRSPHGLSWCTIHHALSKPLISGREQQAVESSYQKATGRILANHREPFCMVGWMRELEDWIRDVLVPNDIELKDFEQLNGCETFSLIRFATTRQPVWFKAVGEPNLHEYGISLALARLLPDFVPTILGTKPEWHGWLMSDGGGATLAETLDPSPWLTAITTLAELQISSIDRTDDLLEAGCRDLRLPTLLELVDPFLDTMAELMKQQTKVPPSILSRQELSRLSIEIKDALHCLQALPIPNTVGHSDFNPGNIIVGPERCVFIDWAEAHVSHPFLTFEYFLSHLRKDYPTLVQFEGDLRSYYAQQWQGTSSPEQVAEAFLFSPLAAVFAYAAAGNTWRNPDRLKIPQVPGYLRSLTRRMKQEAEMLQRRRVECPN
jgi:phosphotransferase family enzyme